MVAGTVQVYVHTYVLTSLASRSRRRGTRFWKLAASSRRQGTKTYVYMHVSKIYMDIYLMVYNIMDGSFLFS